MAIHQTNEISVKGMACAKCAQYAQRAIPDLDIMANPARLLKQ
jgi:hypothetical protein